MGNTITPCGEIWDNRELDVYKPSSLALYQSGFDSYPPSKGSSAGSYSLFASDTVS